MNYTKGTPLVIKDMRKVFGNEEEGGKVAVKSMSLKVSKGETFGLLGPNGAGKTTLISMLTGLYSPNCGNAWINGQDVVNNLPEV